MRKSLGEKRKQIADAEIDEIVRPTVPSRNTTPTPTIDRWCPAQVGARSSPTKGSGSCASPSNDPYESAGKSTTARLAKLRSTADRNRQLALMPRMTKRAPLHRPPLTSWRCRTYDHRKELTSDRTSTAAPTIKALPHLRRSRKATQRPDAIAPTRKATPDPTATCATTKTCHSRQHKSCTNPTRPPPRHTDLPHRRRHYLTDEVLPYVPDAWVDHSKTKIGYEIPLTRHFYTYTPPRPLARNRRRDQSHSKPKSKHLLAEVTRVSELGDSDRRLRPGGRGSSSVGLPTIRLRYRTREE